MTNLLSYISNNNFHPHSGIAILIDPDKMPLEETMRMRIEKWEQARAALFLVGGSVLHSTQFHEAVRILKQYSKIPVVLFPGSALQIDSSADGILLLSLISGRNAELLIGQHVLAAPMLAASSLEILPTGYMLIDGGAATSVSYITQTHPIPHHKPELAAITALAGEQLGLKCVYLDAGSGAKNSVSPEMVKAVRKAIQIPIIVGGGIRSAAQIQELRNAGADLIVLGTAMEENPDELELLDKKF